MKAAKTFLFLFGLFCCKNLLQICKNNLILGSNETQLFCAHVCLSIIKLLCFTIFTKNFTRWKLSIILEITAILHCYNTLFQFLYRVLFIVSSLLLL